MSFHQAQLRFIITPGSFEGREKQGKGIAHSYHNTVKPVLKDHPTICGLINVGSCNRFSKKLYFRSPTHP